MRTAAPLRKERAVVRAVPARRGRLGQTALPEGDGAGRIADVLVSRTRRSPLRATSRVGRDVLTEPPRRSGTDRPTRRQFMLASDAGERSVWRVPKVRDDKTRMVLMVAVILWISAFALLFVSFRLRMKPLMLVGLLDGALALIVTVLAVNSSRQNRLER